jgi:hypothetical protein
MLEVMITKRADRILLDERKRQTTSIRFDKHPWKLSEYVRNPYSPEKTRRTRQVMRLL